jgi:hypothetical protein
MVALFGHSLRGEDYLENSPFSFLFVSPVAAAWALPLLAIDNTVLLNSKK